MTSPTAGPVTTDPSALAAFNQWDQSRAEFASELRRAASEIAPRLDELVGQYRNASDDTVSTMIQVTIDWRDYLDGRYATLENHWTELLNESAHFTQEEINAGTGLRAQYQGEWSSLYMVLTGLNLFFWNVWNEREQLRQAGAHSTYQAERESNGGPNATPLPAIWLDPTPLQGVETQTLGTVIVTHAGQVQNVNVAFADITAVQQLAQNG